MEVVATKGGAPGRVRGLPARTRHHQRLSLSVQIALTLVLGLVIPFAAYVALGRAGLDITPAMVAIVVAALLVTSALICLVGYYSLRLPTPPSWPAPWYPPASALILSPPQNDAGRLADMVARLRREYAAPLQVIVAYTSPISGEVQDALEEMARRDPNFLLLYAERGMSEADALTTALSRVEGEFVGIFGACQNPGRNLFSRAWMWLSTGHDAVQGRSVVSNAEASGIGRWDAVESLAPGYAGHATESFDNTTSFWMSEVLRQTRRHDDKTGRFVPFLYLDQWVPIDPELVASRPAPTSLASLFMQRLVWAQDAFRLKQLRQALRNPTVPRHRKIELFHLQVWRPIYAWLALQIVPLMAYWAWHAGLHPRAWLVPSIGLLALYVVHLTPGQTVFAYLTADEEMRRHKRWFFSYCVRSPLLYAQFENLIHGVAQLRAVLGEPRRNRGSS